MNKLFSKLLFFALCLFVLSACSYRTVEEQSVEGKTSESAIHFAQTFSLQKTEYGAVLKLGKGSPAETFYLLREGQNLSEKIENAQIISVPVRNLGVFSSSHTVFTDALGFSEKIILIDNSDYAVSRPVLSGLKTGRVSEAGRGGEPDSEIILNAKPALLTVGSAAEAQEKFGRLAEAGISVLPITEWQENHPLGRAEWVKVFAALADRQAAGDSIFDEIRQNYESLARKAAEIKTPGPVVFNNLPYRGVWYLPGGASFFAQILADAGADYLRKNDTQTGAIPLDFEAVFAEAGEADIWLNPGTALSLAEISGSDGRFEQFKALREGKVYNSIKMKSPEGVNLYWTESILRPDRLLEDLIRICRPGILSPGESYFFEQLK